jgi:hypothetical protein
MTTQTMKKIRDRTAILLMPLGLMVAMAFTITWLGHSGIAAAQVTAPIPTAAAATEAGWSLVEQYGPIWGGALLLVGGLGALLKANASKHWLAQGRALAAITGLLSIGGALLEWHFNGAPLAGVLITAIMALKLIWSPTVTPVPVPTTPGPVPTVAQGGFVRIGLMLAIDVIVVAVGGALVIACAAPGTKTAAIEHGLWDCTVPERSQAVDALKPMADSALEKIKNPDGSIDTAALKALYSKANLLSDAGSLALCALTSTVAAILATPGVVSLAHAVGPKQGDDLRTAFEAVRAVQFPGVTIKTPSGSI